MKTILRRKDKTSIFCPTKPRRQAPFAVKTKVIELTIACTLLVSGLFIMTIGQ
jgi:hypothetical protein